MKRIATKSASKSKTQSNASDQLQLNPFAQFEIALQKSKELPTSFNAARITTLTSYLQKILPHNQQMTKLLFVSFMSLNDVDATLVILCCNPQAITYPGVLTNLPLFWLIRLGNFLAKSRAEAAVYLSEPLYQEIIRAIDHDIQKKLPTLNVDALLQDCLREQLPIVHYLYNEPLTQMWLNSLSVSNTLAVPTDDLYHLFPIGIQLQVKSLAKHALAHKLFPAGILGTLPVICNNCSPLALYMLCCVTQQDEEAKQLALSALEHYFSTDADCSDINDYVAFDLLALFYWLNPSPTSFSQTLQSAFQQLQKKLFGKSLKTLVVHTLCSETIQQHLLHNERLRADLTAQDALNYLLEWPKVALLQIFSSHNKIEPKALMAALWRKLLETQHTNSIAPYLALVGELLNIYADMVKPQLTTFVLMAIKSNDCNLLRKLAASPHFKELSTTPFTEAPFFRKFHAANRTPLDFACYIRSTDCTAWLYDYCIRNVPEALNKINNLYAILDLFIDMQDIKAIKDFFARHPHIMLTTPLVGSLYTLCEKPPAAGAIALTLQDIIRHIPLEHFMHLQADIKNAHDLEWLKKMHGALEIANQTEENAEKKKYFADALQMIKRSLALQTLIANAPPESFDPFDAAYALYCLPQTAPERNAIKQNIAQMLLHSDATLLCASRALALSNNTHIVSDVIRFLCLIEDGTELVALALARVKTYHFCTKPHAIEPLLLAIERQDHALIHLVASRTSHITAEVYYALLGTKISAALLSSQYGCVLASVDIMSQLESRLLTLQPYPTLENYFELLVFCHHFQKVTDQGILVCSAKNPLEKIKAVIENVIQQKFSEVPALPLNLTINYECSTVATTAIELSNNLFLTADDKARLLNLIYTDPNLQLFEQAQFEKKDLLTVPTHGEESTVSAEIPVMKFLSALEQAINQEAYGKAKSTIRVLTKIFSTDLLPCNPNQIYAFLQLVNRYFAEVSLIENDAKRVKSEESHQDIYCQVIQYDLLRLPALHKVDLATLQMMKKLEAFVSIKDFALDHFFDSIRTAFRENSEKNYVMHVSNALADDPSNYFFVSAEHDAILLNNTEEIAKPYTLMQFAHMIATGLLATPTLNLVWQHIETIIAQSDFDLTQINLPLLEFLSNYTDQEDLVTTLLQQRLEQPPAATGFSTDEIMKIFNLVCRNTYNVQCIQLVLPHLPPAVNKSFFLGTANGHSPLALYYQYYPHQAPKAEVSLTIANFIKTHKKIEVDLMQHSESSLVQFLSLIRALMQYDATLASIETSILLVMQSRSINYHSLFVKNSEYDALLAPLTFNEIDFSNRMRYYDIKALIGRAVCHNNLRLLNIIFKSIDDQRLVCDIHHEKIWLLDIDDHENQESLIEWILRIIINTEISIEEKMKTYAILILILKRIAPGTLSAQDQKIIEQLINASLALNLIDTEKKIRVFLSIATITNEKIIALIKNTPNLTDASFIILLNKLSISEREKTALLLKNYSNPTMLIGLARKAFMLNTDPELCLTATCQFLISELLTQENLEEALKQLSIQTISELCEHSKKLHAPFNQKLLLHLTHRCGGEKKPTKLKTSPTSTKPAATKSKKTAAAPPILADLPAATPLDETIAEDLNVGQMIQADTSRLQDSATPEIVLTNPTQIDLGVATVVTPSLLNSTTLDSAASATACTVAVYSPLLQPNNIAPLSFQPLLAHEEEDEGVQEPPMPSQPIPYFIPCCLSDMPSDLDLYPYILNLITSLLLKEGIQIFLFGSGNFIKKPHDLDLLMLIKPLKEGMPIPDPEKIFRETKAPFSCISSYTKKGNGLQIKRFIYNQTGDEQVEIDLLCYCGDLAEYHTQVDYTFTVYYEWATKKVHTFNNYSLTDIQNRIIRPNRNLPDMLKRDPTPIFRAIKLITQERFTPSLEFLEGLAAGFVEKNFFNAINPDRCARELRLLFFCGYGFDNLQTLTGLRLFEYLFPSVAKIRTFEQKRITYNLICFILGDCDHRLRNNGEPLHPSVLYHATHYWLPVGRLQPNDPINCLLRVPNPPDYNSTLRYINHTYLIASKLATPSPCVVAPPQFCPT